MDVVLILLGVGLLYGGGEALVKGASSLARRFKISPLVIGLTVVAFGTSSPELAATLAAVYSGSPDIAFGNVVGSNTANLGLILGLCALIFPIRPVALFLRREIPFMLGSSALLLVFAAGGVLVRWHGVVFLALLAFYLWYLLRNSSEPAVVQEELEREYGHDGVSLWRGVAEVVLGIVLLVAGAEVLVRGAVGLARDAGISERVIGFTMVAVGTSLPELASSVVAAMRKEGDIILGNLIGSNVFNTLGILGVAVVLRPLPVASSGEWLDLTVMMGVSLLIWPFLATGLRLDRWEGGTLLGVYTAYVIYLFL